MPSEFNTQVAERLRLMAELLEQQGDNGFRVGAYRRAAATIEALAEPADEILRRKGRAGLVALPNIGAGIAAAIAEMAATGRWAQLDRLTGRLDPTQLFQTIPGIGPKLAARLHDELDVDTLEQLELAAHEGRLEQMAGVGPRRAAAIRLALNERLGRRRIRRAPAMRPPLADILTVDASYRSKAAAGKLRKIAPRRFNPGGEAWLPIMHEDRGAWRYTALYSNTARAHELKKTHDWVVVYCHTDDSPESQCTIVTETHGPLKGKRVVRGREQECAAYYGEPAAAQSEQGAADR
jgi:putative hydrolase